MSPRNSAHIASRLISVLVFALLAPNALAGDWYVDAVNGSDSNSGTSPQAAWRTLTHAVTQVPAGSERFLVAPGTYNAALGESFPIRPKPGHQVIGLPGEARPVITAEGVLNSRLFRFESSASAPQVFGADTRLENLLLRRASWGVEIVALSGDVSPSLVDLELVRMNVAGVSVLAQGGTASPTIERSRIGNTEPTSNSRSIQCNGVSSPGILLRMVDCQLTDNGGAGIELDRNVDLRLVRCQIDSQGMAGITGNANLNNSLRLECIDTVITNNLWAFTLGCDRGSVAANFTRCTIGGSPFGPDAFNAHPAGSLLVTFDTSIVITQGPLLSAQSNAQLSVLRSFFSDSSYDGLNGCFSGDARFRDELGGDFRLKYGSPCIDAAWSDAPAGALDAEGELRDTDGDLDRVGHTDLGAFEFRPLELVSSGKLGSPLQLRSWGAQGAVATIYWTRKPLGAASSTPFGTFLLDPNLARVFRVTSTGYDAPTLLQRLIPNDPALVGQTFSFQSLVDSAASPILKAFTNGVEVTVTP